MKHTLRPLICALLVCALTLCPLAGLVETAASTPLVVAYQDFSEKFSYFYCDTQFDRDVFDMTQVNMLTTDRTGRVVTNAIEGETVAFNGVDYTYTGPCDVLVDNDEAANVTTYTIKLKEGLVFSDGVPVTADDIIFTYYALLDPSYNGSSTVNSYDIIGLQNYRTQTTGDVYDAFSAKADAIRAAGEDHVWAEGDDWTQAQQEGFWASQKAYWIKNVQSIVDFCRMNYLSYAPDYTGFTEDEVRGDPAKQVVLGMAMWGYGEVTEGTLTAPSGKRWNLSQGESPTVEDYYAEFYAAYAGDPAAYFASEAPDATAMDIVSATRADFIAEYGAQTIEGGIPNITGIKKLDDYTVEIKTNGFEAPAIYNLCAIPITPMHYYGNPDLYDYENNRFGFPFGDLSSVEAKTTTPMGAGPYKFVKYENRVVYFEANDAYYKGAPKTKYIQFKETNANEVVSAVVSGTADCGEITGSKTDLEEIAGYNANGEITGDRLMTSQVDNLGYGYIGLNAQTMNVGGDPASHASRCLRRGFATLLSVYRDVALDSYYGQSASVINYPISNTSWAAPRPTDPDYKVAFSVDASGADIYAPGMDAPARYAAALEAAKGYFIEAGYTWDEKTGKFTAAPEGAKLSYEIFVPGDGIGDHPSFAVVAGAAAALAELGITLKINDPVDPNVVWDAMDANVQELWCAAWQLEIDPDMYQNYHSSGIVGRGGSDSNNFSLDDAQLDRLIVEARASDDQAYRKTIYKQALDIIVDWTVEVPVYQRLNSIIFSLERLKADSLLPDATTFYGWLKEIEKIELA